MEVEEEEEEEEQEEENIEIELLKLMEVRDILEVEIIYKIIILMVPYII